MDTKLLQPFYDMEHKERKGTGFFFLEQVLKARLDLNLESDRHPYDQETNVYLAGLLQSLLESDSFLKQKPYISAFDIDVREYLEEHPGVRVMYNVYRDNADFGLVLRGLFTGYVHQGSYSHIVMPGADEQGKVAIYYELAGSALSHLQGKHSSLVDVFNSLAENMAETVTVLRRAATAYFEMVERISEGSWYHLQKEIHEKSSRECLYKQKLDEFLVVYKEYKESLSAESRSKLVTLVGELKNLDEKFRFDESLE